MSAPLFLDQNRSLLTGSLRKMHF